MTNYDRGADFERKVAEDLVNHGWLALRSAGSHGLVDIVAFPDEDRLPWLIQCKINGRLGPAERLELARAAAIYRVEAIRASRPKRGKILYARLAGAGARDFVEVKP